MKSAKQMTNAVLDAQIEILRIEKIRRVSAYSAAIEYYAERLEEILDDYVEEAFDGIYNLETALDEIVEKFPRKEIARYVLKTVRTGAQELVNDLKELRDHLESVHEYYAERLLALDDQEDQA